MSSPDSSYTAGSTIADVAAADAAALITGARARTVNEETAYGLERRTAYTFTLSGGGPASDVTILTDDPLEEGGEAVEGWFTYYEPAGAASVYFNRTDAASVLAALTTAPDED